MLFVDEVHRMPRPVEEVLYPALEDFVLDVVLGKGPTARSIRLELPRFTLVAATTRPGRITLPLRERFGFSPRLDYYSVEDLTKIVGRSAGILGVRLDEEGAVEIAGRSRGTPRIANRLLRRVRDFAEVRHDGAIDGAVARGGLEVFDRIIQWRVDRPERHACRWRTNSCAASVRSSSGTGLRNKPALDFHCAPSTRRGFRASGRFRTPTGAPRMNPCMGE